MNRPTKATKVKVLETWIDGKGRERHTILWVKEVECVLERPLRPLEPTTARNRYHG